MPIPLDNPFLHPDDRQTLIDGGAGDTIYIHKAMDDLAQSGATAGTTDLLRFVVGLEGAFEVAGRSVSWDISYNRGESESETQNTQLVQANYEEALDVEVDGSGNIVCSSGNSACVPLNIFGIVTDPAAIDYVTVQGFENAKIVQKVFEANISAEIIDLRVVLCSLHWVTRHERRTPIIGRIISSKMAWAEPLHWHRCPVALILMSGTWKL